MAKIGCFVWCVYVCVCACVRPGVPREVLEKRKPLDIRDMRLNAKYLSNSALCAIFENGPKIVFL